MDYDETILDDQLDWLTVDHDDFQKEISDRFRNPPQHPSMSVIDQWEEETIQRIRHTALLARRALFDALDRHIHDVQERLNNLTRKLNDARMGMKYFDENDIKEWAMTLHELKRTPEFPVLVDPHVNIQGITMDLRKYQPSISLNSTFQRSNSPGLISTLHDIILPVIHSPKRTELDRNEVRVNNGTSSNPPRIIPPKVVTFQEQPTNKPSTTTTRIRRAHAEIPFDSNTNYPLRGPPTSYH